MDNTEVKQFADHFLSDGQWIRAKNEKETECQYFIGGDGKNFCKATSQTECTECKFFNPTFQKKLKFLVANLAFYEEVVCLKNKDINSLRYQLDQTQRRVNTLLDIIHEQEAILWMDMISRATD